MIKNLFIIEANKSPRPFDPREIPDTGLQIVPTESPEIHRQRDRTEIHRSSILDIMDEDGNLPAPADDRTPFLN